ncbi:MAG: hypothetical protein HRT37_23445 [Alteromonadaceae bacterium]|nr:hypothetical protein [Alteromonadaceae bacterium]
MKILLSSLTKNILETQVKTRSLRQFAKDNGQNIDTLRKIRKSELKGINRVQKIIEYQYEIVLIDRATGKKVAA